MISMVGFAGLAREAGLHISEATFMTAAIWAMPAQLLLVGAIGAGVALPTTALLVGLSSVRLLPMVVALLPELRGPHTRRSTLLFLSCFVVITSWVFALQRLGQVPREFRTAFFAGFAVTLALVNTAVVVLAFVSLAFMPAYLSAAFAFLSPVYFLMSLFGSARTTADRLALALGIMALPLAHYLVPSFDILVAGLSAGLIASTFDRKYPATRKPTE